MRRIVENEYNPERVSHPGETLKETLASIGMSQKELAERMGRPIKTINEIVKGKTWIMPETALQLETVLGVPANFWMSRQNQHDESIARSEQTENLERYVDWLKLFPLKQMKSAFGLPLLDDKVEQVRQLLTFFGVASPKQWEDYWFTVSVSYRKSNVFKTQRESLSAWLRQGELEAQRIRCEEFDESMFRDALDEIRLLTRENIEAFEPTMKKLCAESGVAHILTQELPKTRICGATRWLGSKKAMIQQSLRYKTNDQFWFTFFHEAGHVLLHGKENLFVDLVNGSKGKLEAEANRFAGNFLIPRKQFNEFVSHQDFSRSSAKQFAKTIGIAPGIVVGRLQHDRIIAFSELNDLKARFGWE